MRANPTPLTTLFRVCTLTKVTIGYSGTITEASSFADLGADSLDYAELAVALEAEFGVEIPDDMPDQVRTVGDAVALIDGLLSVQANRAIPPTIGRLSATASPLPGDTSAVLSDGSGTLFGVLYAHGGHSALACAEAIATAWNATLTR